MDDAAQYYRVLEVEPGASREEIDRAYRDLAFVWHPDRIPDDNPRLKHKAEEKLKLLNAARRYFRDRLRSPNNTFSPPAPASAWPPRDRDRVAQNHGTRHPDPSPATSRTDTAQSTPDESPFRPGVGRKSPFASPSPSPYANPYAYVHPPRPKPHTVPPYPAKPYRANDTGNGCGTGTTRPPVTPPPAYAGSRRSSVPNPIDPAPSAGPSRPPRRSGPDLSGSNLSGANLQEKDFSGRNLSQANLSNADLSDAFMHQVNLSGANLHRAKLFRANLLRADLSGADLREANLVGADLSGADLRGADLRGAKMYISGRLVVKLVGANLDGAMLPSTEPS